MLRGLRRSVRGVRFRPSRQKIAFFAPARDSRLRAGTECGNSGAARCGDHRAAKFVKFVHFHSVISSNLPQGVSESCRWRVRRQRACPNSPNWDACPLCLSAGESPSRKKRSAVRARGTDIFGNSAPQANASSVCRLWTYSEDAPPFVGADRLSVLQRKETAKDALKLRDQHRQRKPRKAPIPP
jgi:hypothetical protein